MRRRALPTCRAAIVGEHGNPNCDELIDEAVESRNHEGWRGVPLGRSGTATDLEFCVVPEQGNRKGLRLHRYSGC
jgi:hypothetical protein